MRTDPWYYMNAIQKGVALRAASLALAEVPRNPHRTLHECVVEAADVIPEIIAEHCKLAVAWDSDHPERTEHWILNILELVRVLAEHGETIAHGDQTPTEAEQNFRRFYGASHITAS